MAAVEDETELRIIGGEAVDYLPSLTFLISYDACLYEDVVFCLLGIFLLFSFVFLHIIEVTYNNDGKSRNYDPLPDRHTDYGR